MRLRSPQFFDLVACQLLNTPILLTKSPAPKFANYLPAKYLTSSRLRVKILTMNALKALSEVSDEYENPRTHIFHLTSH